MKSIISYKKGELIKPKLADNRYLVQYYDVKEAAYIY